MPEVHRQFIRFALIGITATAVHVFLAVLTSAHMTVAPLVANFIGYCAAVLISYFGHALITFRVGRPGFRHFRRFVVMSLMSLLLSSLITAVCTAAGGSVEVAMLIVFLTVPLASFIASKLWVFRAGRGRETIR